MTRRPKRDDPAGSWAIAEPLEVPSLQEAVYRRLRKAIQDGVLPGQNHLGVGLRELADVLGVSTMPVREAVRRLEAEGLVTFNRRSGIRVTRLSAKDFHEIADMRIRLERLALERSFDAISPELMGELRAIVDRMDSPKDPDEWRQLNYEFHQRMLSAADSPRLLAAIENLWVAVEPYLRLYVHDQRRLGKAQEEHHSLIRAVERGQRDRALQLVEQHIRRVERLLTSGPDSDHLRPD